MNSSLKSIFLGAVLCAASSASAQVVIQNFSAFQSPNTFFLGSWELTGDAGGTNSPRSTFSQGAGVYNFVGGTNDIGSGAFVFLNSPLNISGQTLLEVSARTLAGNLAPSFTISLFDSIGQSADATFFTSSFIGAGFTTVQVALNAAPGFDPTDLSSFQISGGAVGGAALFNVAFDNLVATAPRAVGAVPEPSTYGIFGAVALLGIAVVARSRRRSQVLTS